MIFISGDRVTIIIIIIISNWTVVCIWIRCFNNNPNLLNLSHYVFSFTKMIHQKRFSLCVCHHFMYTAANHRIHIYSKILFLDWHLYMCYNCVRGMILTRCNIFINNNNLSVGIGTQLHGTTTHPYDGIVRSSNKMSIVLMQNIVLYSIRL